MTTKTEAPQELLPRPEREPVEIAPSCVLPVSAETSSITDREVPPNGGEIINGQTP